MTDYLVFTLYGPMQSWGNIAVGQVRNTDRHPSKSAVLGLLAAALGVARDQASALADLATLGFAVRVDRAGDPLTDYHTAQVPSRQAKAVWRNRRDELAGKTINTVLSTRTYLTDAVFTVALWDRAGRCDLAKLAAALEKPKFTLYLGRKSCPLALPPMAEIHSAPSAVEALIHARDPRVTDLLGGLLQNTDPTIFSEEPDVKGETVTRWDQPLSRQKWTFAPRFETRVDIGKPQEDS